MVRALFVLVLIFSASSAQAAQSWTGTLSALNIGNVGTADLTGGGTIMMNTGYTVSGSAPACSRNNQIMGFDSKTANGQSLVKMLLAAKLAGLTVIINGSGNCSFSAVYEDISSATFL